jgi:hypothetical protein
MSSHNVLTSVSNADWLAVPANFNPITILAPARILQYAWLKYIKKNHQNGCLYSLIIVSY